MWFVPCACPYCGKLGQQCDDHLLINIDVTFGEVWGPASGLFRKFVHRDEDGETLSRTLAFLSACEVVAVCVDHYAEGGPDRMHFSGPPDLRVRVGAVDYVYGFGLCVEASSGWREGPAWRA